MASPLEITIGLHYWTTPTEYSADDDGHRNSQAVQTILVQFVNYGLLNRLSKPNQHGGSYEATDALRVWVDGLRAVPFPVKKWCLPHVSTHESQPE